MPVAHLSRQLVRARSLKLLTCLSGLLYVGTLPAWAGQTSVTTYHNDVRRNGWNLQETVLTPSTVAGGSFKQLVSVALDQQIDAEPLFMPQQTIAGGVHDTVYVATENNSVYAIDAQSGQILVHRNFGPPVPLAAIPGGCPNNVNSVGINSTPVIDPLSKTLYVITFNYGYKIPAYWIHALDLGTLQDKIPRVRIGASATLTNGQTFNFDSSTARQRAALLLRNGTVYAAFTSFCDNIPSKTRGWVLGWKTGTLDPINRIITNKLARSPQTFFLSTIWMSGYGLSSDAFGSIYFVTGNSDPENTQFYPNNLSESVVKMRSDLGAVQSYFTPGTVATGREVLDEQDLDFGSGGVMIIPVQQGKFPRLAVAAGKVGMMYLMRQGALGGYTKGANKVLQTVDIGQCYCGPSYYLGSDGIGRVVTSGGQQVMVWKIITSSSAAPQLVLESTSAPLNSGQDAGFFTSVTSNGTQAGSQLIWALSRPSKQNPGAVQLYAFDPSQVTGGESKTLFIAPAGQWANGDGNYNIVPMVANGRVYVASYKQLTIFGVAGPSTQVKTVAAAPEQTAEPALPGHVVYGKLTRVDNTLLTLQTRTGTLLTVDSAPATKAETRALPVVGRAYAARGEYDGQGVLHAVSVQRVKDQPELWNEDR
jgi:outer membrane protein assembly factor BamB